MNAIEAMQSEIEYQVQDLHKLDLSSPVSNCLFVGSGDSYIAGLAAQYFSGSRAICCSPIDIIKNPLLVKGAICLLFLFQAIPRRIFLQPKLPKNTESVLFLLLLQDHQAGWQNHAIRQLS